MFPDFLRNIGRGLIEIVFIMSLIFILLGVFTGYWILNLREARSVCLENQLTNLKYSIELYRIVEGEYPEDLSELNKACNIGLDDSLYPRRYLELQVLDKEGYPIDPYGRRFIYDRDSGKIGRRKR